MTDLHDLIRRMADELDHYRQLLFADCTERHALATEARAALAEPQGEGPTDARLLDMAEYDHGFDRMDCTDGNRKWMTYEATGDKVIAFARAAIATVHAQSTADWPSDEQILQLSQWHEVSYTMSDGAVIYPMQHGCDMRDAVLSFARAVLARYGHQPAPPAEGEVAELVAELREIAQLWESDAPRSRQLSCAADLLEVQAGEAQP
jgi:hypothetical protein